MSSVKTQISQTRIRTPLKRWAWESGREELRNLRVMSSIKARSSLPTGRVLISLSCLSRAALPSCSEIVPRGGAGSPLPELYFCLVAYGEHCNSNSPSPLKGGNKLVVL